jgi:hypothetical protein
VNRQQAIKLLEIARTYARPVNPERLGGIGRDGLFDDDMFYAVERGEVELGSVEPKAKIPFVAEAWAQKTESADGDDGITAKLLINRTPSVEELGAWRARDKNLWLVGNGLRHCGTDAPKKGDFLIVINVTTPHCPITSDGKTPDLTVFADDIMAAVSTAMR